MKKVIVLLLSLLYLGLTAYWSPTRAEAVRIAVGGDPALANLADVVAAQLCNQPGLSVLERAELDKLGQEKEIQSVVRSKDFSPVQLLPAEGLVLLRAVTDKGKTGVFARLVAVQPGVVLREVALPDNADPVAQAQALVNEFTPYWEKLAAIQQGKMATLSLLGLRFEVDAPETRELERSVNILLASRLSAEPDTLVLERWRLDAATFENNLKPQTPSPFWTGSSLIDGSMRMKGGQLEVTLRQRRPQGAETSISDRDTPENLVTLIDRLAGKICDHPLAPNAWKPADEAGHFAQLGTWCLNNRLYDEGTDAFESTIALGDHSRTMRALEIETCAMQVLPSDLWYLLSPGGNNAYPVPPDSIPMRVAATTRMIRLTEDYAQPEAVPMKDQPVIKDADDSGNPVLPANVLKNLDDPDDLSLVVLGVACRGFLLAYIQNYQTTHPAEVAELRHEMQRMIARMDKTWLSRPPSLHRDTYLSRRSAFAGLWHEKPEETLAFYREILKDQGPDGTLVRQQLFRGLSSHEPHLSDAGEPVRPSQSVGQPWIIAWDGRETEQIRTMWQDFIHDLAQSPDPVVQADALKFAFGSNQTVQARNDVLTQMVALIEGHEDLISGPQGGSLVAGLGALQQWAADCPEDQEMQVRLANVYIALFQKHAAMPASWLEDLWLLFDRAPTTEMAQRVLTALNEYDQWYQTQTPRDDGIVQILARERDAILARKPELQPKPVAADSLGVNRFWDVFPANLSDPHLPKGGRISVIEERTLQVADDNLWFLTLNAPHAIFCVDPAKLEIVASYPIPAEFDSDDRFAGRARYLQVTPQWFAVGMFRQALLGSRGDDKWQALAVPPSSYKPRWVQGELYLLYHAQFGDKPTRLTADDTAGSGLIHVSLPSGECENVISSRRIPPQTPLDGQLLGRALDVWSNSTGLNVAFSEHPVYAKSAAKGDWAPVTSQNCPLFVKVGPEGTLIEEGYRGQNLGQLTLLGDGNRKLLLSSDDLSQAAEVARPIWNLPAELHVQTAGERAYYSPLMRGEDLCLYFNVKNGPSAGVQPTLYYFAKGTRDGIKIPLTFDLEQIKFDRKSRSTAPVPAFDSIQGTSYGLIIPHSYTGLSTATGFWVIPWSEIDAYRSKAREAAVAPADVSGQK